MTQIQFLTPEQIALIPEYQEKWRRLYLSTQPIEQVRAAAAIKGAYAVVGKVEPEVVFCASPKAALAILSAHVAKADMPMMEEADLGPDGFPRNFSQLFVQAAINAVKVKKKQQAAGIKPLHDLLAQVLKKPQKQIGKHINNALPKDVSVRDVFEQAFSDDSPFAQMHQNMSQRESEQASDDVAGARNAVEEQDWTQIESQLSWVPGKGIFLRMWLRTWIQGMLMTQIYGSSYPPFKSLVCSALSTQENRFLQENPPIVTSELAMMCTFIDFVSSVLKYPLPDRKWAALQGLVKHCGWILAVDGLCVVCDRPTHIRINDKLQFHGNQEPALQYSDGFSLYAHDGSFLPEKFGAVPIEEWQAEWLLEETYANWQKILMKKFGAMRLYQELPTVELETSQGYKLLKVERMTVQSDRILIQTNPDTAEVHAVFIPHIFRSIQVAIPYAHKNYIEAEFPRLGSQIK